MSMHQLRSVAPDSFDLVSVDLFDTLLLRDSSVQRARFAEAATLVAAKLRPHGHDIPAGALLALRREVHKQSYRAVAVECPQGDTTLERMLLLQLRLLGLAEAYLPLLVAAEIEVEQRHLAPNRGLLRLLKRLRAAGKRVVAISDMYLSRRDVTVLIKRVVGHNPLDQIYMSSELGMTKHAGALFARVAALEGVRADRILHCGDNPHADLAMSRAAGCQAVLLKRSGLVAISRFLAAARVMTTQGGQGA